MTDRLTTEQQSLWICPLMQYVSLYVDNNCLPSTLLIALKSFPSSTSVQIYKYIEISVYLVYYSQFDAADPHTSLFEFLLPVAQASLNSAIRLSSEDVTCFYRKDLWFCLISFFTFVLLLFDFLFHCSFVNSTTSITTANPSIKSWSVTSKWMVN